jgi:hypothetical protein
MEHLRRNGCPEETMKALSDEAPRLVMPVPRLEQDLKALLALNDPLVPPERAVRSKHLLQIGFGSIIFWMVLWNGSQDRGKNFQDRIFQPTRI